MTRVCGVYASITSSCVCVGDVSILTQLQWEPTETEPVFQGFQIPQEHLGQARVQLASSETSFCSSPPF